MLYTSVLRCNIYMLNLFCTSICVRNIAYLVGSKSLLTFIL